MEPPRDDRLIAELGALRPTPRPQFAAELDQRVAAGFPRRSRLALPWFDHLPGVPRLLSTAGGVAIAAIAIATVVALNRPSEQPAQNGGSPLSRSDSHSPSSKKLHFEPFAESGSDSRGSGALEAEAQAAPSASAAAPAGSTEDQNNSFNGNLRHREVERSAEVALAAEPGDVADDASRVFEAVHANGGIVLRSSTRQGPAGEAGARFELLIPSARLADALASFSEIDEVLSRHEATADITAPTVSVATLLRDSRARVDSLLAQLEAAESESERTTVEAELASERRRASRLAARLDRLRNRADFSRVMVRIETGAPAAHSGSWGIGDALHDAGRILSVAAAVTLVGLAILAPLALLSLVAWLLRRTWVRRERRRALG